MKKFHKTVTPPLYCFYEILIQNFFRYFEGHIFLRLFSKFNEGNSPTDFGVVYLYTGAWTIIFICLDIWLCSSLNLNIPFKGYVLLYHQIYTEKFTFNFPF